MTNDELERSANDMLRALQGHGVTGYSHDHEGVATVQALIGKLRQLNRVIYVSADVPTNDAGYALAMQHVREALTEHQPKCRACEHEGVLEELYGVPLCEPCREHLQSTSPRELTRQRIDQYVNARTDMRRRLQKDGAL